MKVLIDAIKAGKKEMINSIKEMHPRNVLAKIKSHPYEFIGGILAIILFILVLVFLVPKIMRYLQEEYPENYIFIKKYFKLFVFGIAIIGAIVRGIKDENY